MADPTQPRTWQGARSRSSGGRSDIQQARLRKICIIAAVMLVLAGAITGLFLYLRESPRPTLVVLRIDQYRDPRIPISPWAAQDREGLRKLGLEEKNTFTSQEKELLRQSLSSLGKEQRTGQPLMIYLSAYAAVQDDGAVALLPADAKLDNAATWLPIKEVLAAIQQCPVKQRLLVLDLAQPCVEPRAGLLAANVPERLKPVLETAVKDDPNLQILAACAPGQASLASEELGHTVFAHYLIQGLAGRADGFPDKKPDNRVTVRELAGYVTMQVDRWAYGNTGLRQTPEFFGNAVLDYELTGTDGMEVPMSAPLPREYPPFLMNGWAERDRWWQETRTRTPPELFQQVEQTLLRADERWRKGTETANIESDLKAALTRLQRERSARIGPPEITEPRSLAEAVARGQKPPQGPLTESLRKLKALGNLWAAVKQPKPNEKPSESDAAMLPKKTEEFLKPYEQKPFDLAWTIFMAASQDSDLRQDHLRCWCELLQAEGKPLPPYEEIRFLKRLADLPAPKPEDWPAGAGQGLQLVDLAERVETLKPSKRPWLAKEYAEAGNKRQEVEKLLFSSISAERMEASKPLTAALQAYLDLHQHLQSLRDAERTLDEAMVFLPGYTTYIEHDPSRIDVWLDAGQNARALQDLLSKTPEDRQAQSFLRQVGEKSSTLRNSLKILQASLGPTLLGAPIVDSRLPRAADAMEMRALLRLPGLTAPQRQTIWGNARDLSARLNEIAQAGAATDTLPPPDEARAVRQENERAQLRATISQGMLRLKGSMDVEKVDAARKRVARAPQEEAAWEALRKELRQAWNRLEPASKP